MGRTEKLSPRTLYICLKGQGIPQLIVISQLSIRFHSQNQSTVNRN